jgi:hypothetical protein
MALACDASERLVLAAGRAVVNDPALIKARN